MWFISFKIYSLNDCFKNRVKNHWNIQKFLTENLWFAVEIGNYSFPSSKICTWSQIILMDSIICKIDGTKAHFWWAYFYPSKNGSGQEYRWFWVEIHVVNYSCWTSKPCPWARIVFSIGLKAWMAPYRKLYFQQMAAFSLNLKASVSLVTVSLAFHSITRIFFNEYFYYLRRKSFWTASKCGSIKHLCMSSHFWRRT